MIEITNTKGGRKRYNEDIRCLQESALAFTEIFKDTDDNFVISGCGNHQSGYVWLNGKIRRVQASDTDMSFIVCKDTDGASIPYQDNTEHIMCYDYEAEYSDTASRPCISKINGKFPRLEDAILGLYGILKNYSDGVQTINSDVLFDNLELLSHLTLNDNVKLTASDNGVEFYTPNGNFRFRIDRPLFECFDNDGIIWQINGSEGELKLQNITGNELVSQQIYTSKFLIGEKDIKDTFSHTNYPKIISGEKLILDNGKVQMQYQHITIKQSRERIWLFGIIEKQYILGSSYNNVEKANITLETLQNNTYGEVIKYSDTGNERLVLFKSYLRLPDTIDAPKENMLPGTMLMSNIPQSVNDPGDYVCGNAQLIIGADKHLYFLLKTGQRLLWKYSSELNVVGPYINFSFYID